MNEVPSIVASCQQTRFHLVEAASSPELSVEGLNIGLAPAKTSLKTGTAKGKTVANSLEILTDAQLKLKGGVHYGLLGRNGTGKSTILRAIAEKLIPGLPYTTKISILQQTAADEKSPLGPAPGLDSSEAALAANAGNSILEHVVESDRARTQALHELSVLSDGVGGGENDAAQLRAYRRLRHERLMTGFREVEKNASLRSGARGSQARKDLIAFEKKVKESEGLLHQEADDLDCASLQDELRAASELMLELQTQLESMSLVELQGNARDILRGLGFKEEMMQKPVEDLSGGWRMRCKLAGVLFQEADIMILDEPTNFLDLLGIVWLQRYLTELRSTTSRTVLLVSHDREFIDNVCEEIILLKDQSLTYFRGNLTEYEEDLRSRKLNLTRMKEAQDRQIAHMEKTISTNIKAGKKTGDDNKLRQAVSRQKRIEDRSGMQVSASGTRFKLSRDMAGFHNKKRADIEIPPDEKSMSFSLPLAPDLRFPGPLISLEGISVKYAPGQAFILKDLGLTIHMGDRVGIIGLNGSGKSTLIKVITDAVRPTAGNIMRHSRLRMGYYSQHAVEDLQKYGVAAPKMTSFSLLAEEARDEMDATEVLALLGSLGVSGRTALDVPVAKLSGGQLARLALARIVWTHPYLLVLDEVTTHLDFYTVTALAKALAAFNGGLLIVSHDRFLIRYVVEGSTSLGTEDGGDADSAELSEERRKSVYILKDGKLNLQAQGVSEFERTLKNRINKLLIKP